MEQGLDAVFMQTRANDTETTDDAGSPSADAGLAGYIVKVNPAAVHSRQNTLGTQHNTAVTGFIHGL